MNSDLITQRNKYDKTGECIQSGLGAEQIFDQIAESKNLEVKKDRWNRIASQCPDMYDYLTEEIYDGKNPLVEWEKEYHKKIWRSKITFVYLHL